MQNVGAKKAVTEMTGPNIVEGVLYFQWTKITARHRL